MATNSIPIEIADAVLVDLNAHVFTPDFTATRSYRPIFDLETLKTLTVVVAPRARASAPHTRADFIHSVDVDIAVLKKLTATDLANNTAADALMDLVEEIVEFFNGRDLTDVPAALWAGTRNEPIYSPEHWEQYRQFTSVVTVTYDLPKARV